MNIKDLKVDRNNSFQTLLDLTMLAQEYVSRRPTERCIMQLASLLVPTYRQMLVNLSNWLKKAQNHFEDSDLIMSARLAPDMYPLSTQVRFSCVQAHEGVYRLQQTDPPPELEVLLNEGRNGGDTPGTIADALSRIDEAVSFLDQVGETSLNDGADKPLALELPMGIAFDMTGDQFARDWALSQFYFHIMTAYAILRHEGLELGKADYVGHMFGYLRPGTMPTG